MKDGIYFVVFRSNQRDFGNGTVVVKDNAVNGGDFGFTYRGKIEGGMLTLRVNQHDPSASSVFPGVKNFELSLSLQESGRGYQLNGSVVGMPQMKISIDAKFIGELI
ncbi:negative regulator GrlR [Citrobacter sp. S2-9]|uniref:Negative regulator GrlR n=1 Tax=Citrobacter enshiensis TaxID=2971264 RepID=A0ABT8PRA1_9ENTR|nr:GrlR family regulatory protein [Citrobacter enshiensis]MDN8598637.1 negative regulator GrlR [Citrobacter enshiensis]